MLEIGIHKDIPHEAYHADPCATPSLSASIAKVLLQHSPLHAWAQHPRLNPGFQREEATRSDIGTVAHDLLLQGGTQNVVTIDPRDYPSKTGSIPEGYTNNAIRAARDSVRGQGKVPILLADWTQIQDMVGVAMRFVEKSDLEGCFGAPWEAESTIIWSAMELPMRSRADRLNRETDLLLDYKTTSNANPEFLTRQVILQAGYEIQNAFYRRGYDYVLGRLARFLYLFQEIEPPYACSIIALEPALEELGDLEVDDAIRLWSACVKSGTWPAYTNRTHFAIAPAWALARLEGMK